MDEHIDAELADYHLGLVEVARRVEIEEHLGHCGGCSAQSALLTSALAALGSLPNEAGLDALSATLERKRLHHFAPQIAQLFDLGADAARAALDQTDDERAWMLAGPAGLHVMLIAGGTKCAGAITGFVRLQPDADFPYHRHTGHEAVLVLQGGYVDSSGTQRWRGEMDVNEAGSAHGFRALPGIPCLVAARLFGQSPFGGGRCR